MAAQDEPVDDLVYYRKRIETLQQVADSEQERAGALREALKHSDYQLEELGRRHEAAQKERELQRQYMTELEDGADSRDAELARLRNEVATSLALIAEKEVCIRDLRETARREELRARVAQDLQRLRREDANDIGRPNRKLALAAALRHINQRIKHLEGDQLNTLRGHEFQCGLKQRQEEANLGLREEAEKAKLGIEEEMRNQQGLIRELACKIDQAKHNLSVVEGECDQLETAPAVISEKMEALRTKVQELRESIAATERDRRAIEEDKRTLAERIVRSAEPERKMAESMMLLKAAVINLHRDYTCIVQVRDRILRRSDQEAVFKEAHNTIKTALNINSILPTSKKWVRGRTALTEKDIGMKGRNQPLQAHEYRAIFKALQDMVIAWDVMPEDRRRRMTTCDEVVANAVLLYNLARHTLAELNKILADKRLSMDASPQPASRKAGGRSR
eukprot:TRINITY_DN32409_c0_g1_i1.p1 TRINITY_DN32409_c0_g1~~TRINITY_DN32409_c0_g1_i1.p1  ORF type:complete len:450 (+),score=209.15 TRINITY_DN32409_c0_g1_i1:49-1398(+)